MVAHKAAALKRKANRKIKDKDKQLMILILTETKNSSKVNKLTTIKSNKHTTYNHHLL
jgi:hypothetical protein